MRVMLLLMANFVADAAMHDLWRNMYTSHLQSTTNHSRAHQHRAPTYSEGIMRTLATYGELYEKEKIHQQQSFLGVRFGQDPMDALVMQEIVFDVAPDLIIEMGTNSGGSSLYYAFLLEAVNPEGKIVTVDVEPVEKWSRRWHERRSAVDSPYWKKRVTQLLGYSTSASVQQQVTAMAERVRARGGKVLVVLDGCHDYACVKEELSVYAPLVTVGSYCVVEDTSRWKFYDGAGRAAREFSAAHQGTWKVDKTREYLYYSEHHDGFLKRLV